MSCYTYLMVGTPNTTVGKVGTMDVIKFGTSNSPRGVVYDPDTKFTSMDFEGTSLDKAFYIIRWETDLDKKAVASILGSLALAEYGTKNYIVDGLFLSKPVAASALEMTARKSDSCIGIRVEQERQTFLWRLPIWDDSSSTVVAFLNKDSDIEAVAGLAKDTAKVHQAEHVLEQLPFFHQAFSEYAEIVIP